MIDLNTTNILPFALSILIIEIGEVLFRLECGNTPRPRAGDGLSISFILDVPGGKDARDVCIGSAWLSTDIAVFVGIDLPADKLSGRIMADGIEESVGLERLLFLGFDVAHF